MAVSNKAIKENLRAMVQRSEDGALIIEGLDQEAKSLRKQSNVLKQLEADYDQALAAFRETVGKERAIAETKGQFFKTCRVSAGDEKPVQVIWKDTYKPLDTRDEPLLKQAFGERYSQFFGRQAALKVNEGVSLKMLREALGDEAWDKLLQFCEVSEHIRLRGKVMEAKADLRNTATKETSERIDIVLGAKQHVPQVRL